MSILLSISLNISFGAQKKRFIEAVLLCTHKICFGREIFLDFFYFALLSRGLYNLRDVCISGPWAQNYNFKLKKFEMLKNQYFTPYYGSTCTLLKGGMPRNFGRVCIPYKAYTRVWAHRETNEICETSYI